MCSACQIDFFFLCALSKHWLGATHVCTNKIGEQSTFDMLFISLFERIFLKTVSSLWFAPPNSVLICVYCVVFWSSEKKNRIKNPRKILIEWNPWKLEKIVIIGKHTSHIEFRRVSTVQSIDTIWIFDKLFDLECHVVSAFFSHSFRLFLVFFNFICRSFTFTLFSSRKQNSIFINWTTNKRLLDKYRFDKQNRISVSRVIFREKY